MIRLIKTSFFPAILIGALFFSAACFAQSCDISDLFEIYNEKYDYCEDIVEETSYVAIECIDDMNILEIREMAELYIKCGYHDLAAPFLEKYEAVYSIEGYDSILRLDALLTADEDAIIKYSIQPFYSSWSGSDVRRFYALSYSYYGDFETSASMLEATYEKTKSLRVAHTLSRIYLMAANYEKAAFYADAYRAGDEKWPGPFITYGWINYYLGDYERAKKYLGKARESNGESALFLESVINVTEGNYDLAVESLTKLKSSIPYVDIWSNNALELDFAKFFIELINSEKTVPDIDELTRRAEQSLEQEKYYEAGLYYYLLTMVDPYELENVLQMGRMMELNGTLHIAAIEYSLYLRLNPEAEEKDYIEEFLASRKCDVELPVMTCAHNLFFNECERNDSCEWSQSAEMCFEKKIPCEKFEYMEDCMDAPKRLGCYWNSGLISCVSVNKSCSYYENLFSCEEAPRNKNCVWSASSRKCVRSSRF